MGWLLFSNVPSQSTLVGGVVISGATLWLARRESAGTRQRAEAEAKAAADADSTIRP